MTNVEVSYKIKRVESNQLNIKTFAPPPPPVLPDPIRLILVFMVIGYVSGDIGDPEC